MSESPKSLTEHFLNFFDVKLVTDNSLRMQAGRVRYRVYCEEFGFEPSENFPDGCETDGYDAHSLECLVVHRRSARPAGCVRLICATDELSMAFEDHCRESIYLHHLQALTENRNRYCEVSRLAVDTAFRKHPLESGSMNGTGDLAECCRQERRTFSLVGVAALLAVFAMAGHSRRNEIFAMMEPCLPRLLGQMGIVPEQAGDPLEYHGQRTPYFITTDMALGTMREDLLVLFEAIKLRLAPGFEEQAWVA